MTAPPPNIGFPLPAVPPVSCPCPALPCSISELSEQKIGRGGGEAGEQPGQDLLRCHSNPCDPLGTPPRAWLTTVAFLNSQPQSCGTTVCCLRSSADFPTIFPFQWVHSSYPDFNAAWPTGLVVCGGVNSTSHCRLVNFVSICCRPPRKAVRYERTENSFLNKRANGERDEFCSRSWLWGGLIDLRV